MKRSEEKTQTYHLQIIPWVDLKSVVVHEKPIATPSNDEELDPLNFRAKILSFSKFLAQIGIHFG